MNIINQHQDKTNGAFNQIKGPGRKVVRVFQEQFQNLKATNYQYHYALLSVLISQVLFD